ncbi:MAG: glycosyltransferase family 2 protein [Burkholderiales bacterium]
MNAARLSICMPTYNYGRFIAAALQSIPDRADHRSVEIVVLDGGSTDETAAVVAEVSSARPNVRYFRRSERGGIDADLARSVSLATGEYCWLLSADDALAEGALDRMLREIEQGYELVLCNRVWCDAELRPIRPHAWLSEHTDRVVDLSDRIECSAYLTSARSLGALFSFMSCIVFRRAAWMSVADEPALNGSHYAHVARLLSIGLAGGRLKYIADPLVLCRGGTDSFRAGGLASRLLIDLRGYKAIAAAVFPGDDALQSDVKTVVRKEHPWHRWVKARSETSDVSHWNEVEAMLGEFGYSRGGVLLIEPLGRILRGMRRLAPSRP